MKTCIDENIHEKENPHTAIPIVERKKLFINHPLPSQISELRQLWKNTFGDTDAFLDLFQETAFSLDRCRCVVVNDMVVAALYWFNCEFFGNPIAYIYAVATAKEFRGQGLCHALMTDTHEHLKINGYIGAILSPASESLFHFYENMGYKTCAYTNELVYDKNLNFVLEESVLEESVLEDITYPKALCACETSDVNIRKITKEEFAKLRRQFLPNTAVLQEKENLDFLEKQAEFYAGDNFLLTAQISDASPNQLPISETHLHGIEFLGDQSMIPSILQTLGCSKGWFRTIGTEKPLGMYYSLKDIAHLPTYLGFIFD